MAGSVEMAEPQGTGLFLCLLPLGHVQLCLELPLLHVGE